MPKYLTRADDHLGIAPHSLRAVTTSDLHAVLANDPGGPIHIHIAEQTKEVDACLAWSGQRPVEWLLDHVEVDARWCHIHATHMTQDEAVRLARARLRGCARQPKPISVTASFSSQPSPKRAAPSASERTAILVRTPHKSCA